MYCCETELTWSTCISISPVDLVDECLFCKLLWWYFILSLSLQSVIFHVNTSDKPFDTIIRPCIHIFEYISVKSYKKCKSKYFCTITELSDIPCARERSRTWSNAFVLSVASGVNSRAPWRHHKQFYLETLHDKWFLVREKYLLHSLP